MDQRRTPYADAIANYASQHYLRLNTPGHQVSDSSHPMLSEYFGNHLLNLDVQTMVEGIDLGPYPTPLDEAQLLAADAWSAARTWFLTNGASMGNVMACLALRALGDRIVLQRSVHSSVIDGLAFSGLAASFIYPSVDKHLGFSNGITPDQLKVALTENPTAVAAYVVSPSYFGAVADIPGLAKVAHDAGIPLVVDEAWRALDHSEKFLAEMSRTIRKYGGSLVTCVQNVSDLSTSEHRRTIAQNSEWTVMLEQNSDDIAAVLTHWLQTQGY
ncbi:MAG: aminotransferase class I/II-fold pyridoxal phosphate-dependent enzyme [Actinobacteria bacterium]|nr:aminotransferase class I/II-fold pyridoxal phosphate-dependent enzyme [Actinomycetota bacterium]